MPRPSVTPLFPTHPAHSPATSLLPTLTRMVGGTPSQAELPIALDFRRVRPEDIARLAGGKVAILRGIECSESYRRWLTTTDSGWGTGNEEGTFVFIAGFVDENWSTRWRGPSSRRRRSGRGRGRRGTRASAGRRVVRRRDVTRRAGLLHTWKNRDCPWCFQWGGNS